MASPAPALDNPLQLRRISEFGLARVAARRGAAAALRRRVEETLALRLPDGPQRAATDEAAFLGVGPGAWIGVGKQGGSAWAERLAELLQGLAAVSDQSSGYALFHLSGSKAAEVLAKGVPVDLDAGAFGPKSVAVTGLAHMDAILWREDGGYVVAVFRSLDGSFLDWLEASAAEFGVSIPVDCRSRESTDG
jgi:heterotetrameric sarcosine oxidase gamma subunit